MDTLNPIFRSGLENMTVLEQIEMELDKKFYV